MNVQLVAAISVPGIVLNAPAGISTQITLSNPKSLVGVNDTLGQINFIGDGGDPGAVIKAEADLAWDQGGDTTDHPGRLLFCTTADNAANVTERMRITSSGNIGIGTASPNVYPNQPTLTINGTDNARLDLEVG